MAPSEEEMNVSQWKPVPVVRPQAPAVQPPRSPALPPSSLAAPTNPPPAGPVQAAAPTPPEPAILTLLKQRGLDPIRCFSGALRRYPWWLGAAGLGLVLGLAFGLATTVTVYSVKVRLVKKQATSVFRSARLGEAYSPPALKPATLISAAFSYDALQRVAARANPPRTVAQIRNAFSLTEEKKTDLLILEVWGTDSPEDTTALANTWAEELVAYTRDLQAAESHDIRTYLQKQIESMDAETTRLDREMVELVQREGMVDAQKEIESYLRSLSGIELEYHNARISLESLDTQINALRGAIRSQNPAGERLRTLRAQYEELRSTYTETNPIVLEAGAAISQLEDEIRQQNADPNRRDDSFTGTGVGDALYIELIKLENEKKSLTNRSSQLEKLLQDGRREMQAIPEKAMAYQKLADRKASLISARELIAGRFQEAKIFEERSPGYLGILAPATADEVSTRGRTFKTGALGLFGAAVCGGFAFALVLLLEIASNRIETRRELELILGMDTLASFSSGAKPDGHDSIWNAWIVPRIHERSPICGWAPFPFPEEDALWVDLAGRAARLFPSSILVDLSPRPLQPTQSCFRLNNLGETPPPGVSLFTMNLADCPLSQAQSVASSLKHWSSSGFLVLVRFGGPAQEPQLTAASLLAPVVFLASLSLPQGTRASWMSVAATLRQTFPGKHRLITHS
ncbi:MAG: hypothetical protein SFU85_02505 [Candidatus Methylacidiphilales bacterium]|nr:hypothetical protein [Candidatus Methylacidiphilales bacterium]